MGPDRQAYVALQPWPPPIPTDPGCYGLSSAVKPVVYSPLPEGFKGGREISDTTTLSLFQIRHFVLTDLDSHSQGGGEERSSTVFRVGRRSSTVYRVRRKS